MTRLMIIPAAGAGTRLGASEPKLLVPVDGQAMIDHLLELYAPFIDRFVLVVSGDAEPMVRERCAARAESIDLDVQREPTGMLDAMLIPLERVRRAAPNQVWITWCDQIAVHPNTVRALASHAAADPAAALIMPTVRGADPYIHLVRDGERRITRILHRREGDEMPAVGESDMGLFCLSRAAYLEDLVAFAHESDTGALTGERNFLPFIPWIAARAAVVTFPAREEIEAIGINTIEELQLVERHLSARRQERG